MGIPFVYNTIRPLVVGIDMTPVYQSLEVGPDDVVVDIGCGTGDALNYLTDFRAYHGFDTDPIAIANAQARFRQRPNVHFMCKSLTGDDLAQLRPTRLSMNGLLHHLPDAQAIDLLGMCARAPGLQRVVTQDVVYLDGRLVNNLLARLDRGRHVRALDGYRALVAASGLELIVERVLRSHPRRGLAMYLVMVLERHRDQPG
jgi:SAM-dependent methyltransferase